MFCNCNNLISIEIPNQVTEIGKNAFLSCISLTNIAIPERVRLIDSNAFANCSNIECVYCKPMTPPELGTTANNECCVFLGNHANRKIYVPRAMVDAYKLAEGWNKYADAIVGYDF